MWYGQENFTLGHFICLYFEQLVFIEIGLGGDYLGWEATAETWREKSKRMQWKTEAEKEQEKTMSKGKNEKVSFGEEKARE